MTEEEIIKAQVDKPYDRLFTYLTTKGYKSSKGLTDRVHNLNKVTFVLHERGKHIKVTVWHMWVDAGYGIMKPGLITDVDYKDLTPRYEVTDAGRN